MKKIIGVFLISLMLLSACAKQAPGPITVNASGDSNNLTTVDGQGRFSVGPHNGLLGIRQYFYPCHSTSLPAKYKKAAFAQAVYLKANTAAVIELQGFSSPGGSTGYNLGLAQQRVQGVENLLRLQGVSGSQIKTVSYGGETSRPYSGRKISSSCRVDLVYKNA